MGISTKKVLRKVSTQLQSLSTKSQKKGAGLKLGGFKMGKMQCLCYLNNRGFKIGRKYATVYDARNDKTLVKALLTNNLRERLEAIKDEYPPQDARRTAKAIDVIFEAELANSFFRKEV